MRSRKPVRPLPIELDAPPPGPDSRAAAPDPSPLVPPCVDAVLSSSVEVLCAAAPATTDPLHGEMLGSDASGIWWMPSCAYGAPGADFERRIGYAYAAALDVRGGPDGLAALRALQAGAAPGVAEAVTPTAERLAARGISDPPWWAHVGGLRAVRAAMLSGGDDGHRSRVILIEIERGSATMALGVLVDADGAGAAASIGVFEPLERVRDTLRVVCPDSSFDELLRPMPVDEARERVLRAIERTDLLGTSEHHGPGFVGVRGLALRWMATIGAADGRGSDGDPAGPGGDGAAGSAKPPRGGRQPEPRAKSRFRPPGR